MNTQPFSFVPLSGRPSAPGRSQLGLHTTRLPTSCCVFTFSLPLLLLITSSFFLFFFKTTFVPQNVGTPNDGRRSRWRKQIQKFPRKYSRNSNDASCGFPSPAPPSHLPPPLPSLPLAAAITCRNYILLPRSPPRYEPYTLNKLLNATASERAGEGAICRLEGPNPPDLDRRDIAAAICSRREMEPENRRARLTLNSLSRQSLGCFLPADGRPGGKRQPQICQLGPDV